MNPDVAAEPTAPAVDLAHFAEQSTLALTRFAYLLCGDRNTAEDLVQDAFYAMYRRFGPRLPLAAPTAYARKAIVNANISRLRRPKREVVTEYVPDRPVGRYDGDIAEQDAMWRLLAELPSRQRSVLVMRYHLDLPDTEIAALLGVRIGTVRSLASRAFAVLRQHPSFHTEDNR